MAISHASQTATDTAGDSDYGSDIDGDTWDDIFSQSQSHPLPPPPPPAAFPLPLPLVLESIEEAVLPHADDAETPPTRSLRLARIQENLQKAIAGLSDASAQLAAVEIEYEQGAVPSRAVAIKRETPQESRTRDSEQPSRSPAIKRDVKNSQSPLQRFRTQPKKPLSVTDIVSPAWCELQYWYSLTKYGRIRRTAAMKQGSRIHKEKEREVHIEVPVETTTREDKFGLRLWNVIQGLRTLRATGLTRELEVFGLIDGEVIIGVIDELTFCCPDEELETKIQEDADENTKLEGKKNGKEKALPADQSTLSAFFPSSISQTAGPSTPQTPWLSSLPLQPTPRTLYLVDIKTRQSKTLPKLGSQMRATQMQLMLYRHLFTNLASNSVAADRIFARYSVDPRAPFSDTFMAQLASLDLSSPSDSMSFDDEPGPHDPLEEILSHNTVSSLWAHMIAEFSLTVSPSTTTISPLLTAEFRASDSGDLIGWRGFPFDQQALDEYVGDEMKFWRGEREAQGVDVEEAYKCGICEFREGCEWRIGKVEEAKVKARGRSVVGS